MKAIPAMQLAVVLGLAAGHCSKSQSATTEPAIAPAPAAPAAAAPSATAAVPSAPAAVAASGPRANIAGEHYALAAAIANPAAIPGDAALTVEVHGDTGYHVNQLYPVALDLTPTNATAPAQLHRSDAAELTQQVASFRVPVHVTGAGATVSGTMRFAVCSDENCVPHSQAFAVALP